MGAGTIDIVTDVDGSLYCDTAPPPFVAFSPELVEVFRRSGSLWATIDGDTITMRVHPETLYYRLTGAVDLGGGLVAQRMYADGRVWR